MKNEMKTIKVWDTTHTKLSLIKAVKRHKTFDETIEFLIHEYKGEKDGSV